MLQFSRISIFVLFLSILTVQSISATSSTPFRSIYDVLRSYGLPIGLLPKGVRDFSVDESGRFEAHLDQACTAKFEDEVHYDRNVSGKISYGKIGSLSGVTAQDLFLWFPVKGIRVDIPSSGIIYFDVGVIYKQFPLSLFDSPPDCSPSDRIDPLLQSHDQAIAKSKSRKRRHELDQEESRVQTSRARSIRDEDNFDREERVRRAEMDGVSGQGDFC